MPLADITDLGPRSLGLQGLGDMFMYRDGQIELFMTHNITNVNPVFAFSPQKVVVYECIIW